MVSSLELCRTTQEERRSPLTLWTWISKSCMTSSIRRKCPLPRKAFTYTACGWKAASGMQRTDALVSQTLRSSILGVHSCGLSLSPRSKSHSPVSTKPRSIRQLKDAVCWRPLVTRRISAWWCIWNPSSLRVTGSREASLWSAHSTTELLIN